MAGFVLPFIFTRMNLKSFRNTLLQSNYFAGSTEKGIESEQEWIYRVADYISEAELIYGNFSDKIKWRNRYLDILNTFRFLPNSPTLMNAGTSNPQLSACFVLPANPNHHNFFSLLNNIGLIHGFAGGTGFNFSNFLQTKNSRVSSPHFISDPLSAIRIIDKLTDETNMQNRRRGANMAVINFNHPKVNEFVSAKYNDIQNQYSHFNFSVLITDDEIETIANRYYKKSSCLNCSSQSYQKWKQLIFGAWKCGEPGLLFFDTINKTNPLPLLGPINSTNPCGEVPLFPYESCNLGSINLPKYIRGKSIDWYGLKRDIFIAIRFLDSVIDVNQFVLPEIEEITKGNRKIGLGLMGWAHFLIQLEIPYASTNAVTLARTVMRFVKHYSLQASMKLAVEKGTFTNWKYSKFYNRLKLRNATLNAIAPTGSISIIAQTSYSIEPLFALAYSKNSDILNTSLSDFDVEFKRFFIKENLWTTKTRKYVLENGSIQNLTLNKKIKKLFLTANEISPYWHLQHQKAFQDFTDNAVSKTVNLPFSATELDVETIYLNAWKLNLKGITVFRDSSNRTQAITKGFCHSPSC